MLERRHGKPQRFCLLFVLLFFFFLFFFLFFFFFFCFFLFFCFVVMVNQNGLVLCLCFSFFFFGKIIGIRLLPPAYLGHRLNPKRYLSVLCHDGSFRAVVFPLFFNIRTLPGSYSPT